MLRTVDNVKFANSQDIFQTTRELNASWDHSLNATASQNNQLIDTHVRNAHTVKDKTKETHKDVLMLQDVTLETKSLVSEITKAATLAEPVSFHLSQDKIDLSATDQDHNAHAPRDTLLMVIAAFNALTDK